MAADPAAPTTRYTFLTQPFMRGTPHGQIATVHRSRELCPEKVDEFRRALANGDVSLGETITKQQARKLADMRIPLPPGVTICSSRLAAGKGMPD